MTSEYLITVVTGSRKGAGTDASVSLIIKGIDPSAINCFMYSLRKCEGWRAVRSGFAVKNLNISWSDKVCKEDVLWRNGEERAIISVINRRRSLAWSMVIPYDMVILSY